MTTRSSVLPALTPDHGAPPEQPSATPAKRGRKPGGQTRAAIEKKASKNHRGKQIMSGKVELKTFIDAATRGRLAQLKINLGKSTIGEVIDAMAQQPADVADK